jgi:hypothetical protein
MPTAPEDFGACNGCGVLRNFRCSNDENKACASDSDCGASNTCDEVIGSGLPQGLECGALYTGGGLNAVPLPFRITDTSTVLAKVTSCDSATGRIVTGAVTRAEASSPTCSEGRKCSGNNAPCAVDTDCPASQTCEDRCNLICSEGRKCSGNNAPCVLDGDCPMSETCQNRCLFGAPLPIPNTKPGSAPTSVCTINAVAEDLTGTGTCDGDSTVNVSLRSEVYLTGDLFTMTTPPGIPGVQPCPLCTRQCAGGTNDRRPCSADVACLPDGICTAGTLCLGGPRDTLPCIPGTSDSAALGDTQNAFPTSHDCPPEPSTSITGAIGGLPVSLEFTTGTQVKRSQDLSSLPEGERVFCGFCRDVTNGGSKCFEGDMQIACPSAIPQADGNAVPCTSDADCADGDSYESCTQRNPGAFSRAAATVFSLTGSPAECLADGQAKAATAVGGFCIPPTFDGVIDGTGDLPGPGAVSLEVEAQLVP